MNDESETMTIGGLAKAAEVGVETIRYYQRRGLLLTPEKPYGTIRRYGKTDLKRLNFIRTAQSLGFSLDEIADLLRLDDGTHCREASALAEHKLTHVRTKIASLKKIERVLSGLVSICNREGGDVQCPLITSLQDGVSTAREQTGAE